MYYNDFFPTKRKINLMVIYVIPMIYSHNLKMTHQFDLNSDLEVITNRM